MAVSVFKGTFAKVTGDAPTGGSDAQSVTGVGFAPKGLLLWATIQTAFGSFSAHAVLVLGMTDGTTDFSAASSSEDALAITDCNRRHADKTLSIINQAGTMVAECDITSLDADGFTLSWTTNNAVAYQIHYFALGGSDLTIKCGRFASDIDVGAQAVTGVGFKPDAMFFISDIDDTAPAANDAHVDLLFGYQGNTGTAENNSLVGGSEDAVVTSNAQTRPLATGASIQGWSLKGGTFSVNGTGYVNSYDADGFTLEWNTAPGNAYYVGYLAIKGGTWKAKTGTSPTSTGTQAITGVGFVPRGVVAIASNAVDTSANIMSVGAASAAGVEGVAGITDDSGLADSAADSLTKNDKLLAILDAGTTPAVMAECDLSSFDADGLTLNWTTVDSSARAYGLLAIGDTPAVAVTRRRVGPAFGSANVMAA